MKFRNRIKKEKQLAKQAKQLLLLDGALKKLVEMKIAEVNDGVYQYSQSFTTTAQAILDSPPGRVEQIRLANQAGRRLIPQLLAMAVGKPSRRDVENLITAYVCLKIHVDESGLAVDKAVLPDLAYGVWYLNDNKPTVSEVESWILQSK